MILKNFLIALAIFITLTCLIAFIPIKTSGIITSNKHEGGYCYSYNPNISPTLGLFYAVFATFEEDFLELWQNDVKLDKVTQYINQIKQDGDGSFGLWHSSIYFSTIQNQPINDDTILKYEIRLKPQGNLYLLAFFIALSFYLIKSQKEYRKNNFYVFKQHSLYFFRFMALIASFLLCISLIGVVMGQDVFYKPEPHVAFKQLDIEKFYEVTDKKDNETDLEYALRINNLIYTSTIHFYTTQNSFSTVHQRTVPFLYNWAIWLKGMWNVVFSNLPFKIEYQSARSFIYRGYGWCGHRSQAVVDILQKNNMNAYNIHLHDHIIAGVNIDGKETLLDPDYGVYMLYSLEHLWENIDNVDTVYSALSKGEIQYIKGIFAQQNRGQYVTETSQRDEVIWEILKWLIPLTMILVWLFAEFFIFSTFKKLKYSLHSS